MNRRPLCQILVAMLLAIGLAKWLGISWIWKSPAGTLPFACAEQEERVTVTGIIYEQEQKTYQNQTYTHLYLKEANLLIQSQNFPIRRIKCTIENATDELLGCEVILDGILFLPEKSGNPGEFDKRMWEESRKIDFYLRDVSKVEVLEEAGSLLRWMHAIKEKGTDILFEIFPDEQAGILEAMIFGEKTSLEEETKNQFQAAGISHIIAISGLHMSLIGMGIWTACKWIGLPMGFAAVGSVGILVGYGLMLGNPTTAFRALLMFGIMMGAKILGRSYDLLSALSVAGIVLLLDNPDLVAYSGFQLSFAAVVGMSCYVNLEEENFQKIWKKKSKVWQSVRSGVSLWFFSLPVVLYSFYQVSVAGILINLLVIPLMPLVLGSGIVAILLGLWGVDIGSIGGFASYVLLKLYGLLGEWAEFCPFGMWTPGKPQGWQIIVYYLLLFTASYGIQYLSKVWEKHECLLRKLWIIVRIGVKVLLVFLIWLPWDTKEQLTVLDVGQGDGLVLQSDGQCILVDGGSSSQTQVGKYILLPYLKYEGISKLDMILITHSDSDHMNGVVEVLEEAQKGWFDVALVAMPHWMGNTEEGLQIENLARLSNTETVYLKAEDMILFGDSQIKILYPGAENFSEEPNAGSLVFEWKTQEGTGLFTGDLPAEQEDILLEKLQDYLFLKVAHHGSNGSTSTALLEKIQPDIALISCGENNRYGHPGRELLERLEEVHCEIYRTDQQGALLLNLGEDVIQVFGKS